MLNRIYAKFSMPTSPLSKEHELQIAIDQNQTPTVVNLLKEGSLANQAMPNGQLPLIYAIRKNNLPMVDTLLKEIKFDLSQKDAQGMTVLDHAMIGANPKMITSIINHLIGSSLDQTPSQSLTKKQTIEINSIEEQVTKLRSLTILPALHDAARKGDLDAVKNLYNPAEAVKYDAYGLAPLHHAVLAGKKEVMNWLLQKEGPNTKNLLTQNQQSLLHLASIGGHAHLMEELIQKYQFDPNIPDSAGRRPLHYALALEDLSAAKKLAELGGNPFLNSDALHPHLPSPVHSFLALAKGRSISRDSLKLTISEGLAFTSIVLCGLSKFCELEVAAANMLLLSFAFINISAFETWKPYICCGGIDSITGGIIGINIANNLLENSYCDRNADERMFINSRTGKSTPRSILALPLIAPPIVTSVLARKMIKQLAHCWHHRSLETLRPIRNAVVHTSIALFHGKFFCDLVQSQLKTYHFLNAWDRHMETEGREAFADFDKMDFVEEGMYGKCSFINNFWRDYMKNDQPPISQNSGVIDPSILCQKKSEGDCILALDPSTRRHAQHILNLSNKDGCKPAYREMAKRWHPDHRGNSDIFRRIAQSAETLGCLKPLRAS